MSLFIHSADFNTGGNSSDGVWEFNSNLKGNWTVIGQHMDTQDFPWMLNGQNTLIFIVHDDRASSGQYVLFAVDFDYATVGNSSDLTAIATSLTATMQARFDAVAINDPYCATTVGYTIDTDANTMTFTFDAAVDIMWQEIVPLQTTVLPSFDLPSTYPNALIATSFTIPTNHMIVDPKYLEVYIAESNTQYSTASGSRPNLYFSTRDGDFTGQTFSIPDDTNTLTIEIRRLHSSIPQPLTNTWFLVCVQS